MKRDFLEELRPFMLYTDVMQNITSIKIKYKNEEREKIEYKSMKCKEEPVEKRNRYWMPKEKDQLFWCFFYVLYGDLKYEQSNKNHFFHETSIKIDAIERLRQKKELLKTNDLKLKDIEEEFSTNEITSVKGLYSFCLLNGIRILYIREYTYLDMGINDNINGVIYNKDGMNSIFLNEDFSCDFGGSKINEIIKDKWKIVNADKPIKAASAYSLHELQEISECFKINLHDNNSKKKTKKVLYQEILSRLY